MSVKILIVDDSSTMLRILNTAAKMTIIDVEVLEAKNGKEALEQLENNNDIKLILLDVNMPVMDGMEFLEIIRTQEKYDHIKVIMQTTETSKKQVEKAIKFKISGYLMKPYQTKTVKQLMINLAPVIGYEVKEK